MDDAVAVLEAAALAALDRSAPPGVGDDVDARALQLLLRRYQRGARDDIGDAVGRGLARALAMCASDAGPLESAAVLVRAAWVELFVDACALSDDRRLIDAIGGLTAALRRTSARSPLEEQAAAIGACLLAASLDQFRSSAADVIDELERLIARRYEPGEPIGTPAGHVRTASTLLIAYDLSGRLPYSMLAEELIQIVRRSPAVDFATACDAVRVLCRLAALHDDHEYREQAILAPGVDYRADAARLLEPHAAEALRRGAAGAIYGVALLELESQPHVTDNPPSDI